MAKKRKARTNKKKHFASMKHFTVIRVFDDLDHAQKALEGLLRAGIHPNQIWYTMRGGDTSMLNALAHLDAPDEEGDFYFHAFEAGHTVVMVQTTDREQECLRFFAVRVAMTSARAYTGWQKELVDYAKAYAAQVNEDYRTFCSAYQDGQFKTEQPLALK
jgi:hypothetical protein